MAHFYASIQGQRGEATRLGSKSSGINGHVRGWKLGASVELVHRADRDVVHIYLTSGSNGSGRRIFLGAFIRDGQGFAQIEKGESVPDQETFQPRTGAQCSCRPGVARDNCPTCEGTGWVIDFAAIRARRAV